MIGIRLTSRFIGVAIFVVVFVACVAFCRRDNQASIASTLRTTNLIVDANAKTATFDLATNGDDIPFNTLKGANSDGGNLWIGGGGSGTIGAIGNTNLGAENVAIGHLAARDATTMFDSVIIGAAAGRGMTTAADNVAIGRSALQGDGVTAVTGHRNTAVGVNAMGARATTAENNVAIGLDALQFVTTGFQNTCVGYETGAQVSTGFSNVAMGSHSFEVATNAHDNVALGTNSLRDCTSCDHMVALGRGTAGGVTIGESDTILGAGVIGLPAALTSWIILADGDGNIRETIDGHSVWSLGTSDGTTFQSAHRIQISPRLATSVNHGALSATATDFAGLITGIGATTTTLTFTGAAGSGFATTSTCVVTPVGATPQLVTVTNSASAPTFSCFAAATGLAANCVDLNYVCPGMQ